jgi:hypothetical protein
MIFLEERICIKIRFVRVGDMWLTCDSYMIAIDYYVKVVLDVYQNSMRHKYAGADWYHFFDFFLVHT